MSKSDIQRSSGGVPLGLYFVSTAMTFRHFKCDASAQIHFGLIHSSKSFLNYDTEAQCCYSRALWEMHKNKRLLADT